MVTPRSFQSCETSCFNLEDQRDGRGKTTGGESPMTSSIEVRGPIEASPTLSLRI
jgi:hypothetical protein